MYPYLLEAHMKSYFGQLGSLFTILSWGAAVALLVIMASPLLKRIFPSWSEKRVPNEARREQSRPELGDKETPGESTLPMTVHLLSGDGLAPVLTYNAVTSVTPEEDGTLTLEDGEGRQTFVRLGGGTLLTVVKNGTPWTENTTEGRTASSVRVLSDGRTLYGGRLYDVDCDRMADGYLAGHVKYGGTIITLYCGPDLTIVVDHEHDT